MVSVFSSNLFLLNIYDIYFTPGLTNVTNSILLSFGNLRRLFYAVVPPSIDSMEEICLAGYQDALQFLKLSGLIQCEECKTKEGYKTLTKEDCARCKELEKQAEDSNLPESLRQVFQEARQSEASTSGFLSRLIRPIRSSLAWLLTLSYQILFLLLKGQF